MWSEEQDDRGMELAGQRRREPGRHRRRGCRGLAGLVLLVGALTHGCAGPDPVDAGTVSNRPSNPATGGGGDTTGGIGGDTTGIGSDTTGSIPNGAGDMFLVGTWENVWLAQLPTDLQRITTRWHFAADGSCNQTVTTYSQLADQTTATSRRCTWSSNGRTLYVHYQDATVVVTFPYTNVDFRTDALLLGGIQFVRVP